MYTLVVFKLQVYTDKEQRIIEERTRAELEKINDFIRDSNGRNMFTSYNFQGDKNRIVATLSPEQALVNKTRSLLSLQKAICISSMLYPDLDVLTAFHHVPMEPVSQMQHIVYLLSYAPSVMLAFINKFHGHVMRHAVHLLV